MFWLPLLSVRGVLWYFPISSTHTEFRIDSNDNARKPGRCLSHIRTQCPPDQSKGAYMFCPRGSWVKFLPMDKAYTPHSPSPISLHILPSPLSSKIPPCPTKKSLVSTQLNSISFGNTFIETNGGSELDRRARGSAPKLPPNNRRFWVPPGPPILVSICLGTTLEGITPKGTTLEGITLEYIKPGGQYYTRRYHAGRY